MSARTIYLSRLLGLDLVLIAIAITLHHQRLIIAIQQMLQSPAVVFIAGIIALGVGLALVIGHNIWRGSLAAVLVTLLGWLSLLKGLVFIYLPAHLPGGIFGGALQYPVLFYIYTAIIFLIGAYLTYAGFTTRES